MRTVFAVVLLASACSKTDKPPAPSTETVAPELQWRLEGPNPNGWAEVNPKYPLVSQVRAHADAAVKAGKKPFVYVHGAECEACDVLQTSRTTDPRMVKALEGTYIISINRDGYSGVDANLLEDTNFDYRTLPAFFRVNEQGVRYDVKLDRDSWGESTVEKMAPTLATFFAK